MEKTRNLSGSISPRVKSYNSLDRAIWRQSSLTIPDEIQSQNVLVAEARGRWIRNKKKWNLSSKKTLGDFEVVIGDGEAGLELEVDQNQNVVVLKYVEQRNVQLPAGGKIAPGLIVTAINNEKVRGYPPEKILGLLEHTQRPMIVRFSEVEVLCRVCEMKVSATILEEHLNYCVMSLKNQQELSRTNFKLAQLGSSVQQTLRSPMLSHRERNIIQALITLSSQASSCTATTLDSFETCSKVQKCLDKIAMELSIASKSQSLFYFHEKILHYIEDIATLVQGKMSKLRNIHKARLFLSSAQLTNVCGFPSKDVQPNEFSYAAPLYRSMSLGSCDRPVEIAPTRSGEGTVGIRDFDIIKPLSKGGYGRVYLARKRTTGNRYALKVLAKEHLLRKQQVQHVETERDILASASSPFVVKLFWTFQTRDNLFMVMEYHPGGDLASLLSHIPILSEEVVRCYIAEIALALKYLHSIGFVHRDLKPENILIAADGIIKLTDFGLSEEGVGFGDRPDLSDDMDMNDKMYGLNEENDELNGLYPESMNTGDSMNEKENLQKSPSDEDRGGSPHYLSPEIIIGDDHGAPVDFWALGVIMYEMLIGEPPFTGDTVDEIFHNILRHEIDWPDEGLSPEAISLISGLLAFEPNERLNFEQVKNHPFFNGLVWDSLLENPPPFVPKLENENDTSYFDNRNLTEDFKDNSLDNETNLIESQSNLCAEINEAFQSFSFTNMGALTAATNEEAGVDQFDTLPPAIPLKIRRRSVVL